MQWWYAKGDQKSGPVEDAQFRDLVRQGAIATTDLVWNETMAAWTRAGDVPGLFGAPSTPPPGHVYEEGGNTPNARLMEYAIESLNGRWGLAIGVFVLLTLPGLLAGNIPCVGPIGVLLIEGALALGAARFFLAYARRTAADVALAFSGFTLFGKTLLTYVLVSIFVLLWMLLLIIPGLIKALSYSMVWFIMADNPEIEPMEAIDRSMKMMDGRKWKYFCLQWRFFGWALLAILTLGIGFLWLVPYIQTSNAHFYEDVKRRA